jgi:beta-lactamase class A
MILDNIKDRIENFRGKIGIYYIDLNSGESCNVGNCDVFLASGSVKLITLLEAFKWIETDKASKDSKYILKSSDYIGNKEKKIKTFGALEYLHVGTELTLRDLYSLSISVSDNIAFNILFRMFGEEEINKTLDILGFPKTRLHRAILDREKIDKGIENYVSIKEIASLFYRMYKGQVISNKASVEMLELLKEHQQNSIIPYYFEEELPIAHQTGLDDDLIMDMGIVYSKNPFILCMAAEDTNTRNAESIMRDITLLCYKNSNKSR